MKRIRFLHGAALAALVFGAPVALSPLAPMPVGAQTRSQTGVETTTAVSVERFHERLAPLGDNIRVEGLGEVWKPRNVADDWQPYSVGRWIFNDKVGWYFLSEEPWAEITFHYGRWYHDSDQGWVWVAGTEWAPAWVEWRRSKQYVGWRPLPPENAPRRVTTRTTSRTTTRSRRPADTEIVEEAWVFIPSERIVAEDIQTVRVNRTRVVEVYEETRPVGRVERRGAVAVNFAIQPQVIEREARVTITSRNLPQPQAAPVPAQVRSIATEQRTTTSTTTGAAPSPAAGTSTTGGTSSTPSETSQPSTTGSATAPSKRLPGTSGPQPAAEDSTPSGSKATDSKSGSTRSLSTETTSPPKPPASERVEQRRRSNRDTTGATGTPDDASRSKPEQKRPSAKATTPDQERRGDNASQQREIREQRQPNQGGSEPSAQTSGKATPPASAQSGRAERRPPADAETTTGTTGQATPARKLPPSNAGPQGEDRSQGPNRAPDIDRQSRNSGEPADRSAAGPQRRSGAPAETTGSTERPPQLRRGGGAGSDSEPK